MTQPIARTPLVRSLFALTMGAVATTGCNQSPALEDLVPLEPAVSVVQSDCREMSLGSVVPKAALEALVPEGVHVKGLNNFGADFEGAENLGIVITRTLICERIAVERDGVVFTEEDKHITHVGTPITPEGFPASPFNNDGVNGASFTNYTFGYYSDSDLVLRALLGANVPGVDRAEYSFTDTEMGDCLIERSVAVSGVDYGYTASGVVPDPGCVDPDHPYIGNWWSVAMGHASVVSTDIPGQAEVRINPRETVVAMTAEAGSLMEALMGEAFAADALGLIGAIPEQTTIFDIAGEWR